MRVPADLAALSVRNYAAELAAPTPCPGGGSAAALVASMASSLVSMVAGLNAKRSGRTARDPLSATRAKLLVLIEKDARVYRRIAGFPKSERGSAAYQAALKAAAATPLEICEAIPQITRAARREEARTSKWLLSDLIEASILSKAAFRSAKLNVKVNLKMIRERAYVRGVEKKMARWAKEIA